MSDSNEREPDTRKSVFPKLEAGDRRKNIVWMSIYALIWPYGIVVMLRGFRRTNIYEKIRVMGTGEKLLTAWLSMTLIFAALVVVAVPIGAYDAISSGEFSDWSPSTDSAASTATPSDNTVHCWLANHQEEMEEASQQLQDEIGRAHV